MSRTRLQIVSPVGTLVLEVEGDRLHRIGFARGLPDAGRSPPDHPAVQAVHDWFRDPLRAELPPLVPAPTPFQQRVREALLAIPCGETRTYGQLARQLDSSPRAVGQACRANPVPILVPCHRVVAAGGEGGYAGARRGRPMEIKRRLLRIERRALEKSPPRPHSHASTGTGRRL